MARTNVRSGDLTWSRRRLAGTIPRVGARNAGLCGDRSWSRDQRGTAFVHVVELLPVLRGFALILNLCRHRRSARSAEGGNLRRTGPHSDPATTAVIGDAGPVVDDHSAAVDVCDVDNVDAIDCPVVIEIISIPIAAVVAITGVAEPVVDAAVEADVQAPIAAVEAPAIVVPAPVTRCPESTVVRGSAPCAGDPVIARRSPAPVARGPDVVRRGSLRLLIFRQLRRRLIGIFDRLRLAVGVELLVGLSVLVGLVLIGWGRSSLLRSRLLRR